MTMTRNGATLIGLAVMAIMATAPGQASEADGLIPGQGDQWPTWRGPLGNGQAVDCAQPLVEDMAKARVAWVSEKELPGPTPKCHTDCNAMGSPVVAEDKVFVYYYQPTDEVIAKKTKKNSKGKGLNAKLVVEDRLLAMDLRTGKTIWDKTLPGKGVNWINLNWAARMQPIYGDGRVYVPGAGGAVYAVDAKTGELVWQSDFSAEITALFTRCLKDMKFVGMKDALSHAPGYIDGVVVFGYANTGYAYDAATGRKLWTLDQMYGGRATDVMAWHQQRHPPAFIIPFGEGRGSGMSAIDAHTGQKLWTVTWPGKLGGGKLARQGDCIVFTQGGLGAVAVHEGVGKLLWHRDDVSNYRHQAPIIHQGHVFTFNGFGAKDRSKRGKVDDHYCIDLATGKTVASFGQHTTGFKRWKDHHGILADGRMYSIAGAVKADPKDFRPLVDQAAGSSGRTCPLPGEHKPILYMCPLIVDGHFIAHCSSRIVSWDLRRR